MAKQEKTCTTPKKTVICISGLAGTGKSTLSKKLAKKYRLRYYSGGDVLKELAKQEGYDVSVQGWWESPQGLKFLNERVNDPKFDKEVDDKLLEYAQQGNVLLDSWTMPWLLEAGFKIWLEASFERRAARGSGAWPTGWAAPPSSSGSPGCAWAWTCARSRPSGPWP